MEGLWMTNPVKQGLRHLVRHETLWTAPLVYLLFGSLVRWAVALHPYSGQNTPPQYGDYEAQRHWMELTINLPTKDWYTHDLTWWGLDYPPLTAFHSRLCGSIGSMIDSSWFELYSSRGLESMGSKLFMRSAVFVSEMIIYIPAVLVFCQVQYGSKDIFQKHIGAILIIMQPALLLIDHGHFQFNSVMLGLTLWAINAFLTGYYVWGAIFFCLSLGFKQMALYYSPAVFAYLLAQCFKNKQGLILFCKLGITVLVTFGILFSPWLGSLDSILQVIHRVFPVARGLFEDKVASVWCTLNIFIKIRQLLSLEAAVKMSLVATLLAVVPVSIQLYLRPSPYRFLYALVNSSLAFFLLSFQVHEKSILLPALPVTLLVLEDPVAVRLFINTAMFSMFPLLKREGLEIPYVATTLLWNYLLGDYPKSTLSTLRNTINVVYAGFIGWHFIDLTVAPPEKLPDLFVVLNAAMSFTGLGLVTPLGVGVNHAWQNLLKSQCGIVSLSNTPGFESLPVRIGACVPQGPKEQGQFTASEWLDKGDDRVMAKFTQFAIAAARQALEDAEWKPNDESEKERTVRVILFFFYYYFYYEM
ncbi:ALG6, ALG8 glycosyltransferase family-domain-containing protein [Phycomyces blakesleeanus]